MMWCYSWVVGISSSSSGECFPSLTLAAAAELMVSHFSFNDYNDHHINLQFAALGFGGFGETQCCIATSWRSVDTRGFRSGWSVGGSAGTYHSMMSTRDKLQPD